MMTAFTDEFPLSNMAAKIVRYTPGANRIGHACVIALVKVIKVDSQYFLSGSIEDPGVRPLFLIRTNGVIDYLTDGRKIWHVMSFRHDGPGGKILGLSYEIATSYWDVTHNDFYKIQDALENYAEALE